MHQQDVILNQEWVFEVFCVQHENLWKWWKVSLKHHLYLILCCCSDVEALWLDQKENCHLNQCVCNCISCLFCSFEQFSWKLFNVLHDLLIFTAFLFSDDLAFLITCLNVFCSIIDDLITSSHSLHIDWSRQVKSSRSSRVLDSSRLNSSQNSWLEYSSWIEKFDLSIWVESENWNRVSTWNTRLDSSRHEDK